MALESTSEETDICSLAESLAKLSVGSTPAALSSLPLGASDSVVSYLDVEDLAPVPPPESAAPVAVSSDAVLLVNVEEVEVSLSTPVLASNATAIGLSLYKRIITNIESEEVSLIPLVTKRDRTNGFLGGSGTADRSTVCSSSQAVDGGFWLRAGQRARLRGFATLTFPPRSHVQSFQRAWCNRPS